MRALILVLGLVVLVVARAPGYLLNIGLQTITRDELRIVGVDGLVWHGRGVIDVLDVVSHSWYRWRDVQWEVVTSAMLQGKLRWRIASEGLPAADVELGFGGWEVKNLRTNGPARYLLQRIPFAYARTGWGGEIRLSSLAFGCTWAGQCLGHIDGKWLDAGWELLPNIVFGDYEIQVEGRDDQVFIVWHTIKGDVRIEGRGTIGRQDAHQLDVEASGNPVLLSRLPAIAGPWAKPTGLEGVWRITYP